jgi:aminopeptidase N
MEPTDARRMFPCWDEPSFRAVFQLTAIVPAKHTALFNMPIERETPLPDGRKEGRVWCDARDGQLSGRVRERRAG